MVDQLLNPTLVVAIGDFGGRVVEALQKQAYSLSDRYGYAAVRNFATLRILTRSELEEAEARGVVDALCELTGDSLSTFGDSQFDRHRCVWFDPDDVDPTMVQADGADAHLFGRLLEDAYPGLRPNDQSVRKAPKQLFREALLGIIKSLFRVDRFVGYHPDHDRAGSRLDVYVVGRFDCQSIGHLGGDAHHGHLLARFLEEHVHCALAQSLEELVHGPLSTLFRPHHSNLACTHLVALPVVEAGAQGGFDEAVDRARRTFARYIVRRQEALDTHGWTVPGRFLLAEDRSERYVLSEEQLIDSIRQFIYLLTFRRNGAPLVLRDLVHPLPDVDRLRNPVDYASRICGAFSIAMSEFPVVEMVRYLRDRQCIGIYNAFSDGAQDEKYSKDMEAASPFEAPEPLTSDLISQVEVIYGTDAGSRRSAGALQAQGLSQEVGSTRPNQSGPLNTQGLSDAESAPTWEGPTKSHTYQTTGAGAGAGSATPSTDLNIDRTLAGYFDDARRGLGEMVMAKANTFGLDVSKWRELKPMAPWDHQDSVVVPFHDELDQAYVGEGPQRWPNPLADTGPVTQDRKSEACPNGVIDNQWIEARIKQFHDAAHDLVETQAEDLFRELEKRLDALSEQLMDRQKQSVDALVDGSPSGWRKANAMLHKAQEFIDRHIEAAQESLESIEFSDLQEHHLNPLRKAARTLSDGLFKAVDTKPIYQRTVGLAIRLGVVWGGAFGALAAIVVPWSLGNLALTVLPSMVAGVLLAWRQLSADNAEKLLEINGGEGATGFLGTGEDDTEPGRFFNLFNRVKKEIFDTSFPKNQRGDKRYWLAGRIEWSCMLWRLRFWKRMRRTLALDIQRLTEVGQSIDHGERRTRGDQMDLRVRFQESKSRWFEDSSRLFGDSSQFRHVLTDPGVAESFYGDFGIDSHRAAEHFINEVQPLDGWRDTPPMTERRELKDFVVKYFEDLESLDFFEDPRSRKRAVKQLSTFMNEYAYKLDLLTDEGMNYDARVASGEELLITHRRNLPILKEVSPADTWPGPWDIVEHPSDPHFVALLHHRQGMTPWELPILGGTIKQLQTLTSLGAREVVLKLIRNVPNPTRRCLAAAYVLQELVSAAAPEMDEELDYIDEDEGELTWALSSEDHAFGVDVISTALAGKFDGFSATDSEHVCPAADAPRWLTHFNDDHRLIRIAVQIYGYRPNPESLVTAAPTKTRLEAIMASCGELNSLSGKRTACRELLTLPKGQRDSDIFGRLYADMVWDKIQQIPYDVPGVSQDEIDREYDRILKDIGVVRPWALKSATILQNTVRLIERDKIDHAKQLMYLEQLPDSSRAPIAGFDFPGIDQLQSMVDTLGPELDRENSEHLVTNLLNCYGALGTWDLHQTGELREILERAHPRRRSGLRKLVARYDAGCLSHQLVDALLSEGGR